PGATANARSCRFRRHAAGRRSRPGRCALRCCVGKRSAILRGTIMWLAASTLWSFAFVIPAAALVPVALDRRPSFPEWFALSMCLGYAIAMLLGWLALAGGRAAMVGAL